MADIATSAKPTDGAFEQLLEFAPDAIVGVGPDGVVMLANQQAETLFGRSRRELVGRPVDQLVPERFRTQHRAHRDGYFAAPGVRPMGADLALFGERGDGSEFPAEISLSSIDTLDGRLALVAIRDVTERRGAEQARARLAAIVDSSNDAIIGHSTSDVITSWNRAAEELYGYSPEEAIGQPIEMLFAEEIGDTTGLFSGADIRHHEVLQVRKDGARMEVALTISPVRDEHGDVLGMATIARDVSVTKRAERTFKGLLEFAPDAIVGIRHNGRITLANRQAEALFGYSRDELLDRPVELLVPDRFVGGHAAHREGYFQDPRTRAMGAGVELYGKRKDGSEFLAEISLSSLETEEGTVAVAAVRDVSERAESERERSLLAELNQARRLESIGQLAGGVAHDFNNLLGVILNFSAFVAEDLPAGSQAREDIDEVTKAAERGAALTRQLLIFSRHEVVKPETLNLNELVAGLENLLRRALGEQVELEVSLQDALWPLKADRGQLEQVIVNLAVNGRDAMPEGGKLIIETSNTVLDAEYVNDHVALPAGDYVRMTISDSGTGMDPEVAERAFEPFYTTKPKGEGTGLGLATVYGIVTEAGGRITLYSEPGTGTSVKIFLPTGRATADADAAPKLAAPVGHGETLLVVEDEPDVRRMAQRILTRAGYNVLLASSGADALELLEHHSIALLLTDVIMPGMMGPDLIVRVRESRPDMKAIYMSGYSHKILAHDTLEHEAGTDFIEKPFTADELQRKIRNLLDPVK